MRGEPLTSSSASTKKEKGSSSWPCRLLPLRGYFVQGVPVELFMGIELSGLLALYERGAVRGRGNESYRFR